MMAQRRMSWANTATMVGRQSGRLVSNVPMQNAELNLMILYKYPKLNYMLKFQHNHTKYLINLDGPR